MMGRFLSFACGLWACMAIGVLSGVFSKMINPECGYEIIIPLAGGFLASKAWAYISGGILK
jgi:hypothetical protein